MLLEHRVAVVIPCYRVERHVADVIRGLPEWVDAVVAVNDASPDGTGAVLDGLAGGRVSVVHRARNGGVGAAMADGFRRALELGADIVVKVDGDGQMDTSRLADLVEPIAADSADYAKGNRFLHTRELGRMPALRLVGNIALTFLTKLASGYWHVFDPQNGYLAIHADYLRLLDLDRLATRRYFFENEMLIQLNVEQARVLDVPMPAFYGTEESSLRIGRVLTYFPPNLVRGFLWRLWQRHVMRDFSVVVPLYLMGSVLFVFGFVFGLYVWVRALREGVPATTGTVMLSVLPFVVGVQMLLQALLFEVLQSPRASQPSRRRQSRRG